MSKPEPDPFGDITTSGVVIVAGKGGVGKTTVTAVLARAAARSGRRVLIVELDGKSALDSLAPSADSGTADESVTVGVRHLSAGQALEEYLLEHGFGRVAKRLMSTGVIEVVSTAAPGIEDLVVLGRIKQLERSGEWDLIVVDGPAAGHAVTMLTSAAGLRNAVRGGPVAAQADDVLALLRDPKRCSVVLVTLPEVTPVNELIEISTELDRRVGVRLAGVVVNQVDRGPDLVDPSTATFGRAKAQVDDAIAAAEFRRQRVARQGDATQRVIDHFGAASGRASAPIVELAALPVTAIQTDDVDVLATTAVRLGSGH